MNIYKRTARDKTPNIKSAIRQIFTATLMPGLGAIALTAISPLATQAQQLTIGRIVGIDSEESTCSLIVSVEGSSGTSTLQASSEICEQARAGQRIQYTPQITQVSVIAPPSEGTIVSSSAGDRICYVQVRDSNNQVTDHYAGFEICEQDLTGAQVRLTYGTSNILDYSCEGDIGCGKSDAAELIVSAEVLSPPPPTRPLISSLPDGNYRYWSGAIGVAQRRETSPSRT